MKLDSSLAAKAKECIAAEKEDEKPKQPQKPAAEDLPIMKYVDTQVETDTESFKFRQFDSYISYFFSFSRLSL